MEFVVITFFGILGAILASFVGVIVERAYTGQSWSAGRSRCDSCGRILRSLDLIPVLSWFFSFGRCRVCGAHISVLNPLAELVLGTLFVFSYFSLGFTLALIPFLLALLALAFIVLYDLKHTVIPGTASSLLLVASFAYVLLAAPSREALGGALLTAGSIGGAFFLLFLLSRGRAMGLGDAPVALALALLAFPNALSGLLFSFWIGALVGIAILVLRRGGPRMGLEVPFAPFLAAGFLLAHFTGWNPFLLMLL